MFDWKPSLKQITSTIGQIVAQAAFKATRSKTPVTRSLRPRTAAMIVGLLFSTPLGNLAAADPFSAAQTVVSQATSQIQNMVISMSEGCSGGAHGVPPLAGRSCSPTVTRL